ncbi:glycoside hydrolase family 65 protein, partial [Rhizobium johnstonii]
IAVAADHVIESEDGYAATATVEDDLVKMLYRIRAKQGHTIRLTKLVAYHTASSVPVRELADRCDRTLDGANEIGSDVIFAHQRSWLDDFWARTDVVIADRPDLQQATRWNLFQLTQATA